MVLIRLAIEGMSTAWTRCRDPFAKIISSQISPDAGEM